MIQLQIWDTAGQESFRNITRIFYKGSHAVILVYDITNSESFENVRRWKQEIENHAEKDVICYLVGNRADLGDTDEREVKPQDGIELMKELSLDHHLETSALSGANIDDLFVTITKHLYLVNSNRLNAYQEEAEYDEKSRSSSLHLRQQ